jgi:hypothetical protein
LDDLPFAATEVAHDTKSLADPVGIENLANERATRPLD